MGEFVRMTGHVHVGTRVNTKQKATVRRRWEGFTERENAGAIARRSKFSRERWCSNQCRRNGVVEGKSLSIDVGDVGRRSRSENREQNGTAMGDATGGGSRMKLLQGPREMRIGPRERREGVIIR
jgi:hypothetical protein